MIKNIIITLLILGGVQASNTQTIKYSEDTVIFWSISNEEIKKFKNEWGEDKFYVIADDEWARFSNLYDELNPKKIKQIHTDKRYLRIETSFKKIVTLDKRRYPSWKVIVLAKSKKPIVMNSISLIVYIGKEIKLRNKKIIFLKDPNKLALKPKKLIKMKNSKTKQ